MGKKQNSLTIDSYSNLNEQEKELVDYTVKCSLKPNPYLRYKNRILKPIQNDFWNLSWNDLILIEDYVKEKNMAKCFEIIYKLNPINFLKLEIINSYAAFKWILERLSEIVQARLNVLYEEPSGDEKSAGIDNLKEFGYYATLDILTKGDILAEDKILRLPYSLIFRKLYLNKVNREIQHNRRENARRALKNRRR